VVLTKDLDVSGFGFGQHSPAPAVALGEHAAGALRDVGERPKAWAWGAGRDQEPVANR